MPTPEDDFPGPLQNPDADCFNTEADTEPDGGTPDGYEALRQILDAVPDPTYWDDPLLELEPPDDAAAEEPVWFAPKPVEVDPARLKAVADKLRRPD
jgi:hypothetical protein